MRSGNPLSEPIFDMRAQHCHVLQMRQSHANVPEVPQTKHAYIGRSASCWESRNVLEQRAAFNIITQLYSEHSPSNGWGCLPEDAKSVVKDTLAEPKHRYSMFLARKHDNDRGVKPFYGAQHVFQSQTPRCMYFSRSSQEVQPRILPLQVRRLVS